MFFGVFHERQVMNNLYILCYMKMQSVFLILKTQLIKTIQS